MKIRSLQQRTLLFILLPIFVLLVALSVAGYLSVRRVLLSQWGDATEVKLQRTAHQIDMRLRQPRELLNILYQSEPIEVDRQLLEFIFSRLEVLDAVSDVRVVWPDEEKSEDGRDMNMGPMMQNMHRFRLGGFELSPPVYNKEFNNRTVSLVSTFGSSEQAASGRIEVVIAFERLIDVVTEASWWKSNEAYLVDDQGVVLASTADSPQPGKKVRFDTSDVLKKRTYAKLQESGNGMVFSSGTAPDRVSGYYRLHEAPWTMVIIAPGDTVLAPIIRFRNIYIGAITISILGILLIVRAATGSITARIGEISSAANDLARGRFGSPLPVISNDEVGELAESFNAMTSQLRQRLALQEAIGLAREVQQNLLPQEDYISDYLEVSGVSLYCDETGGDYFDIVPKESDGRVDIIVGDVVGHGVGAALLMTTVRALIRSRLLTDNSLATALNRVNRILCRDTERSGNFVTLFCLEVDYSNRSLGWVRCGHDPAVVFCPGTDMFHELKGEGIAMGVDPDLDYTYNEIPFPCEPQVILIASDGAWEVENEAGEQFGRERMNCLLAKASEGSPSEILQFIVREIKNFAGTRPRQDDITLAVVKTR